MLEALSIFAHASRAKTTPPLLTGILVVPAMSCQYADQVRASDLLEVDFDVRRVVEPGLYLVEELGGRGVAWRGCRRFERRPTHKGERLWMDYTGAMDWRPIDLDDVGWRVVGHVRSVYRKVN